MLQCLLFTVKGFLFKNLYACAHVCVFARVCARESVRTYTSLFSLCLSFTVNDILFQKIRKMCMFVSVRPSVFARVCMCVCAGRERACVCFFLLLLVVRCKGTSTPQTINNVTI